MCINVCVVLGNSTLSSVLRFSCIISHSPFLRESSISIQMCFRLQCLVALASFSLTLPSLVAILASSWQTSLRSCVCCLNLLTSLFTSYDSASFRTTPQNCRAKPGGHFHVFILINLLANRAQLTIPSFLKNTAFMASRTALCPPSCPYLPGFSLAGSRVPALRC